MDNYQRYINNLASTNSKESFVNSGPLHASVVMSTIFKHAKNYIFLYSGGLNEIISNNEEYQKQLGKFLIRGGKLKILIQNYDIAKEPKIFNLFRFFINIGSDITIKKHPYKLIDNNSNKEIHFLVSDDQMYRLENDVEKFLAVGSFNDPEQTLSLKENFNNIFEDPLSNIISLT